MNLVLSLLLGLAMSGAFAQPLPAQRNVETVGASVRTHAAVQGDFMAMGARVLVDEPVGADALLVGGAVQVSAPVGEDLRVAGGDVALESKVGGDLMVAAGNLRLARSAQVAGRADLAAGDVLVDGQLDGSLAVRARRLLLNGTVKGSVQAAVEEMELGPQARVGGSLHHTSARITQHPAAVVSGAVEQVERLFDGDARWRDDRRHPMHAGRWPATGGWWLLVPLSMGLLGVLALGGLFLFVFSHFSNQAALQLEASPWRALAIGVGVLMALPVLAMLLFFTLLGIPLGLIVMALYPPMLLLGWLTGALSAARWMARRMSSAPTLDSAAVPYGWMALAVIGLVVAGAVPVAGPLVTAATLAAGVGACVLEWRRRLVRPPTNAA